MNTISQACVNNNDLPTKYAVYSGLYSSLIQYIDISSLILPERVCFGSDTVSIFSKSIADNGFLKPVFCDRTMKVTDGVKRVYAAKVIGLASVPYVITPTPLIFDDDILISALLNDSPDFFDMADILHKLTSLHLYTQENIAILLGKSQSFISNKLRLLRFTASERSKITAARLTERHCRALLSIRSEEDRTSALDSIISLGLNVSSAENYISQLYSDKRKSRQRIFENELHHLISSYSNSFSSVNVYRDVYEGRTEYRITVQS